MYKERHRLFCPHRLGRNRANQLRVLCYQYGGESESVYRSVAAQIAALVMRLILDLRGT